MREYTALHNDFLGRVTTFFEAAGPTGIMVAVLGVLLLMTLALFGRRRELLFLLIVTATFSGAMWTAVDSGSTMIRWVILALLALNIFRLRTYPGTPMVLFLLYVFLGIGFIAFSEVILWSMQTGGLLLLTVTAAVAISDTMKTRTDIRRILYLFLVGASAWFALGVYTLPKLVAAKGMEAGRFSGVIVSAPLFVITGGLLLVIAVWGTLCSRKNWQRVVCGVLSLALVVLLLVSGQRTGTFAGLLGCTPLLARKKLNSLVFVAVAMVIVALFGVRLATANKRQVEFLKKRYLTADTTGRTRIWRAAVEECMKSPIIGHGHGGDRGFSLKYHHPTHNSCLAIWYNTGIFGLSLYLAAFASGGLQSWRLIRGGRDQEMRDLGRVFLGLLIAEFLAGMAETACSPSNFTTITLAIVFAMIGRLWVISREEAQFEAHSRARHMRYVWVPALAGRPGVVTVQPSG